MSRLSPRFAILLAATTALVPATALADDNPWIQRDAQSFAVRSLSMDGVVGVTTVAVNPAATGVTVRVEGKQRVISLVVVRQDGDSVVIEMEGHTGTDWIDEWLDWSFEGDHAEIKDLKIQIEVPEGAPVAFESYIGDLEVGSTNGPLTLEGLGSIDAVIGNVSSAEIEVAGGGEIQILSVSGALSAGIAGSGDIIVGNTQSASISVAGSGDVALGNVNGSLAVEIAGSGECIVDNLNGAIDVSIAGSGDVRIRNGRAEPVEVAIAGSGTFHFNGEAVNPSISVVGSGDVWFASYSGQLSSDGGDIRIGGSPDGDLSAPARAPRAPSVPSAPPPPVPPVAPVAPPPPATPG